MPNKRNRQLFCVLVLFYRIIQSSKMRKAHNVSFNY
nr:MAG TPA_asm: hypothetical protein [Caudoviricetes sp.]